MDDLLPFVTNEIGFSLAASLGHNYGFDEDNIELWKKQLKHIKEVNPGVAEFIIEWSKLSKDKLHTAICGILIYRLLESQAEANRMSDMFA